jgi:hypothetical protein
MWSPKCVTISATEKHLFLVLINLKVRVTVKLPHLLKPAVHSIKLRGAAAGLDRCSSSRLFTANPINFIQTDGTMA